MNRRIPSSGFHDPEMNSRENYDDRTIVTDDQKREEEIEAQL